MTTFALQQLVHTLPGLRRHLDPDHGAALDEVLASLQFLKREHEAGRSAWRAFWGKGQKR